MRTNAQSLSPRLAKPIRLAALAAACAASLPALAFNPQPDPPGRWAMMGLVSEQTARLSVLAVPVARGVAPNPCTVTLNFSDVYGAKLVEARTFVLVPGQMQFVDMKGSDLRLSGRAERMQFRTDLHVLHNAQDDKQCNGVVSTVEVFDATGRTNIIAPAPSFVPPDPY